MTLFFCVAKNTYRECLREPIFYVLLLSALFLIGLFPPLSMFVFYEQAKLVADSSMATTLVFGLAAAVLCASSTISKEIRLGTMLLIMSKPVPRGLFVMSKIAGILMALSVFAVICGFACLISLRIASDQFRLDFPALYIYYGLAAAAAFYGAAMNYLNKTPFASSAVSAMGVLYLLQCLQLQFLPFGEYKDTGLSLEVLPALCLLLFAVWVMGAITTALSTRLDMVPNFAACFALFMVGLVSDYLFAAAAKDGVIAAVIYAVIPNWQIFWLADALANKQAIPLDYVLWALCYTAAYVAFCGAVAVKMFVGKEIAGDSRV